MSEPIVGQDSWQEENLDYLAKDGDLAGLVLPLLHKGEYELIENEHGDLRARVTVTLDLSILQNDDGSIVDAKANPPEAYSGPAAVGFGVYKKEIDTDLGTIADLRSRLERWAIPDSARAYIEGKEVPEDYDIQYGDQIEFVHKFAEKTA